jgi:RimJ/RimL family protein N-acetyltransferase
MTLTELNRDIQTPRLTLRAPTEADAMAVAALCADADIPRLAPLGDVDEARSFIENESANTFLVEQPGKGPIGCLALVMGKHLPELGYWIARAHRGRGYATEATIAALQWAERQWGKKAITAGHFAADPASGAVLHKAGFLYTGDVELRPSFARAKPAPTRMMVWLA